MEKYVETTGSRGAFIDESDLKTDVDQIKDQVN